MLFGQSEDKKQVADMMNAKAELNQAIENNANENKLRELFTAFETACEKYVDNIKQVMANCMVPGLFSDEPEVEATLDEFIEEMTKFISGIESEKFFFETKIARKVHEKGSMEEAVEVGMAEMGLRSRLKVLGEYVTQIKEKPEKYARINSDPKARKQEKKKIKEFKSNFLKVYTRLSEWHDYTKAFVKSELSPKNTQKK